jgi:predicted transposase YdaD
MPKLEERINYLKMSNSARNEYIRHQIHNASFENSLEVAMERGKAEGIKLGEMKGIAKGRVEGMAKGRAELAQREREIVENMLKAGMTKEQIELITNLKGRKLASLIRGIRKSTFN